MPRWLVAFYGVFAGVMVCILFPPPSTRLSVTRDAMKAETRGMLCLNAACADGLGVAQAVETGEACAQCECVEPLEGR